MTPDLCSVRLLAYIQSLTVGCKRDEPLFVTSGLKEHTIRPGSLGDAKLNSNEHF